MHRTAVSPCAKPSLVFEGKQANLGGAVQTQNSISICFCFRIVPIPNLPTVVMHSTLLAPVRFSGESPGGWKVVQTTRNHHLLLLQADLCMPQNRSHARCGRSGRGLVGRARMMHLQSACLQLVHPPHLLASLPLVVVKCWE